ncbi:response regulator [Lactiplantibacillus daowaiensis]|uniref:Response regulator n=1 Tax=Lactiplantibacillus daowaiensis TaxID=2559918 RepID=A0ABW1S401_9LACO|nr:response regulator transcription factor [Lactiplantibacillus daowaiensis]
MIKVMLVDDHQLLREGLKTILETTNDFEVVAEATDGQQGLDALAKVTPDIIILDIRMQPMDGITMLRQLRAQQNQVPVVVLTTFDDQAPIQQAMQLGAKGYLLKDATRETIIQTLHNALNGQVALEAEIAAKAFQPATTTTAAPLSPQNQAILTAVAQGYHSKEIAATMHLSERTIKAHLTQIYNDFGVFTRAEAVAYALKHQLIEI